MQKHATTVLTCVVIYACALLPISAQIQKDAAASKLELTSSHRHLVDGFHWAKRQAMAYAFAGDAVGLWYEAALPGREAFCMRDVSHQSMGAQALGLAAYTHNMLQLFAKNVSESKDWCSYWEIDRYNHPAPADYQSDAVFWYDLPANFDVLDSCYRMYLWTGDISYLEDPIFVQFYDRTLHEYITRWDLAPDRVMERQRWLLPITEEERREQEGTSRYSRGIPGYNESDRSYVLGVDLLATQYAAYRDYAAMKLMKGDAAAAEEASNYATAIKNLINTKWWDPQSNHFYSNLDSQHHLKGQTAAGILYRDAAEEGIKTEGALKDLLNEVQHRSPCGVEGASHYAEILYRYGEPDAAYSVLMDLTTPGHCRQEYPEVSYSVIGAITTGLMGINITFSSTRSEGIGGREVQTLPALTRQTDWAELSDLPIGRNFVKVRHNGLHETVFTNQSGPALVWHAALPGTYSQLLVDGHPVPAKSGKGSSPHPTSWVRVIVGAGDTIRVSTP